MVTELKHTVKPSGGDYTGLKACLDHIKASHADFVTSDVYGLIEIDGTWTSPDTTAVNVSSITTDVDHYLDIYTTPTARHKGVWNTADGYCLHVSNGNPSLGVTSMAYVRIDGLQIDTHTPSGNGKYPFYDSGTVADGANGLWLSNTIFRGHADVTKTQALVYFDAPNRDFWMWNCIGINLKAIAGNDGVYTNISTTYGTGKIYSCAFVGGATCYSRGTGVLAMKNCYGGGSSSEDFTGGANMVMTNCASEDTTASGTGCITGVAYDTDTFVSVTLGSEDLHLAADGLSPLQGAGVNTSGESSPLSFTVDIGGATRDSSWDIGAWAAAAAANPIVKIINE